MADRTDDLSRTATEHARAVPASEAKGGEADAATDPSAATLAAAADAKRASARALPATIGKYRIERVLGEGGMGVVYVAFDPDLERRIALKVLRAATSSEAAQRLQREARAMARLKHANVVTVHEVATAAGRDYVAMELVEGESLAEWLRREQHPAAEIRDAFVQAGRGLAAAHAAGIVHRDFKPHNVLRDRAGSVSVTDFGLAREAHGEVGDPLAVTMPIAGESSSGAAKSSSLAALTVTGALLGTPAYMAPEQWTGGAVTPATDQFAYCVALWEALTGARPFTGPTVELLRAQILDGNEELDASKLPRELRAPLLRGLNADPKKRWPSMDALLAAVAPAPASPQSTRMRLIRTALAGAAVAIAIAVLVTNRREHEGAAKMACAPAALAMESVWSAAKRKMLVEHGRTLAVTQLDADATAWTATRASACAAKLDGRPTMLACLDGVIGRMDAAIAAIAMSDVSKSLDAGAILVDPAVCTAEHPPHLLLPSPELRDVLAMEIAQASRVQDMTEARLRALADKVVKDPCASMYAHAMVAWKLQDTAQRRAETDLAEQGAERCTDDRAKADGAFALLGLELGNPLAAGPSVQRLLRQAQVAAEQVMQADLRAALDDARSDIASRANDVDHAIEASDAAMAEYAARSRVYDELEAGLAGIAYRQIRASDDDVVTVTRRFESLHRRAVDMLGPDAPSVRRVEQHAAYWAFSENDIAGAHARLLALQTQEKLPSSIVMRGTVVDETGAPVSGATVTAGGDFAGDELSVALPDPSHAAYMRSASTAADGAFSIDTLPDGIVVAQKGDRRSLGFRAAATVRLQLRPTSRIEGKVALNGLPSVRTLVAFIPSDQEKLARYATVTSVAPDGTFHCAGVPRGKVNVGLVVTGLMGQTLASVVVDVNKPIVTGVALTAPSKRTVYVVLRSAVGQPLPGAQVLLQSGTFTASNLSELQNRDGANALRIAQPVTQDVPREVKEVARDGDLYVAIDGAPTEAATACALPLPVDLSNIEKLQRDVARQMAKVPAVCKPVLPDAKVIVEDVPPWPRLE